MKITLKKRVFSTNTVSTIDTTQTYLGSGLTTGTFDCTNTTIGTGESFFVEIESEIGSTSLYLNTIGIETNMRTL